ncbi:MAG TPA: TonB-dependent receptor [Steroidobacteraceae bacterium]|nr:TonB-dependent receptor [Steroidobacteraceae bacterium]
MHRLRISAIAALVALAAGAGVCAADTSSGPSAKASSVSAATGSTVPLQEVLIIANAPLPGFGLPLTQIPANVQTATSLDMQNAQVNDVAHYLSERFMGVNVSDSADNPFQLDINYHGFTASPLVGTPEGLSVYVDGVRVNESFGDTVNWDLIPQSAISGVALISGSNPVFGLNTLGGALSIQTKNGHDDPGTRLEAYGGSFGRRSFQMQTGGSDGPFDYFATGTYFYETGWRDISTSQVYQLFGKAGYHTEDTDLHLSYTYADTDLFGNGAIPQSMYNYLKEQSYTPDITQNLLHFANLTATHDFTAHLLLSANAYYRHLVTGSNNGSDNDNYLNEGYPGPAIDCSAPFTAGASLAYCTNSASQVSRLVQRSAGAGLQLTDTDDLFGKQNQAIVGVAYGDAENAFVQSFLYGFFDERHLLDYVQSPFNDPTAISVSGSDKIFGAYLTDTFSPSAYFHVNIAARYNRSTETVDGYSVDTDLGDFGEGYGEPSVVTGDHVFVRLNPAVGVTYTPTAITTYYMNYNEASRAPTVIELGCSNPELPCGLPNDFASDPDLEQVVARTFELGLRGNLPDQRLRWSADAFRTANRDDIQFIATTTNSGYFANVGNTRRQGIDLALGGQEGKFRWNLSYSLVDATFQSEFDVSAGSNSTADANGDILIRAGDRIPLIPRHTGKLTVNYQLTRKMNVGANMVVTSGSYLHGDENNANRAGGTNGEGQYIMGSGHIGGYVVVNLQGTYHVSPRFDVFARCANLLNRQYATAGFLTTSTFNPNGTYRFDPGDWTNENAVSPGAPFALWAGIRLTFQ